MPLSDQDIVDLYYRTQGARRRPPLSSSYGFSRGEQEYMAPPLPDQGRRVPIGPNMPGATPDDLPAYQGPAFRPAGRQEMPGPFSLERAGMLDAQKPESKTHRFWRTVLLGIATSPREALQTLSRERETAQAERIHQQDSLQRIGAANLDFIRKQQEKEEERTYQEGKETRRRGGDEQDRIWRREADAAEKYADPSRMSPDNPYRAGIKDAVRGGGQLPEGYERVPGLGVRPMRGGGAEDPRAWDVEQRAERLQGDLQVLRRKKNVWIAEAKDALATGSVDLMTGEVPNLSKDNPFRSAVAKALKQKETSHAGTGTSTPPGFATIVQQIEQQEQQMESTIRRIRSFPTRGRGAPAEEDFGGEESLPETPPTPRAGESAQNYHSRLTRMGYSDDQADDAVIDNFSDEQQ